MSQQNAALPVVLLIPGMLNTSRVWERVIPLMNAHAEIRCADVTHQSTISKMASDAWSLVSDVPSHRRLVICGFSMGGYVALEMLAAGALASRPSNSWALGLLNTSGRAETDEGLVARDKTIRAMERDFEKVIKGVAAFSTLASSQTDESLMSDLLSIMREVGEQAAVRQVRAIMKRSDFRAALPRVQAQSLVISSRHDPVVPPDASEEMASLIPGARLEWVEGAAHMTPLEQPEKLASLLKTLL
jgi:pimeloyl-ACP methyl ester carboxylesterase